MSTKNSIAPIIAALALLANQSTAFASPRSSIDEMSTARLTDAKGTIFKRGFVDWNREVWGEPIHAQVGDKLEEGMQLGTGENSWAQLTWRHITTRAWEKSVYAIAPNQRLVYLMGGELLFQLDKHRTDKQEYYVWTNLLQARIRGTTVMVQSNGNNSKISVLEGSIDVENRSDHSIVHLKPGVVMEVQSKDPTGAAPQSSGVEAAFGKSYASRSLTSMTKASTATLGKSSTNSSISATTSSTTSANTGTTNSAAQINTSTAGNQAVWASTNTGSNNLLSDLTGDVAGLLHGTTGTLSQSLTGTVAGLTGTTLGTVDKTLGTVNNVVGTVGNTVGGITNAVGGVTNSVTGLTNGITNTLPGVVGGVTNSVSGVTNTLGSVIESPTSGGTATNLVSNVLSTVSNPLNSAQYEPGAAGKVTTTMISNGDTRITVFETAKTITTLYAADPKNLLNSPLVTGFPSVLPSVSLIQQALNDLAASKPIANNAQILRVPVLLGYNIGPAVGTILPLPESVGNWPPTAVIGPATKGAIATASVPSVLTGNLKTIVAGVTGNKYNPENPLTQLPVSDVLLGPQLPGGIAPVSSAVIAANTFLSGPLALATNPLLRGTLGANLGSILGVATSQTPIVGALVTPPTTIPSVSLPPVTIPPLLGLPPITVPPIGLPPITLPPISLPPISLPPITITLPPVTVPPILGLPPITVPPITVPPIAGLPPITVPPITVPPVTVPPVTVPPILGLPPITVPPITLPPVTLPPISLPSVVTRATNSAMPNLQMLNSRSFNNSGMGRIGR